jgi:DNA polymerase-3 subunit delta'
VITLRDIVGHEASVRALRRAIAAGRLHHALLLHGPEGVGKRTTGLAVAAALLCREASRPEGDACGACASCSKVDKGLHADVKYVTLDKTVIPIDSIRALRQEAGFRPFEGTHRVFLIDPADRLSLEAQNALLKTLEEPSAAAHIILITSRPAHLLPTTRSRCQALPFGTLPPETLAAHLTEVSGMEPAVARRAARLSGGRFGAAQAMDLEQADALRDRMIALLHAVAEQGPRSTLLDLASDLGEDTDAIASGLAALSALVRDMMLLVSGASPDLLISADRADELAGLAGRLSAEPHTFALLMERLRTARVDVDRSVNRKLLAETLLLDMRDMAESARQGGLRHAGRS